LTMRSFVLEGSLLAVEPTFPWHHQCVWIPRLNLLFAVCKNNEGQSNVRAGEKVYPYLR
jgi:hypothetical protein